MLAIRDFLGRVELMEGVDALSGRFSLLMVVCCGRDAAVYFLDTRGDGGMGFWGPEVDFGVVMGLEQRIFGQFLLGCPRARGLGLFGRCRRLELDRSKIPVLLQRLAELRRENFEGVSMERLGLFFSLFLLEVVEGKIGFEEVVFQGEELMGRFLELLEVHYLDPGKEFRRSGFYAQKLGVSSLKLDGLCKVWFSGKGFLQVHRERLLSQAEYLLLGSDRSIKEVAYELNFCSQQHFRSYFVRNKGMSPLAFRRANGFGRKG